MYVCIFNINQNSKSLHYIWNLSAITSQNKNGSDMWGLCTEILWRGYRFAMNDINPKIFQVRHIYNHPMQMRMFCLTFRFLTGFIISGELVLDDCIYASPERFLDFL